MSVEILELANSVLPSLSELHLNIDMSSIVEALTSTNGLIFFSQLVSTISTQLNSLLELEDTIQSIESDAESEYFIVDLRGLLRSLSYPYCDFKNVQLIDYLEFTQNRYCILDFLIGEVLAARMTAKPKSSENPSQMTDEDKAILCIQNIISTLNIQISEDRRDAVNALNTISNTIDGLLAALPNKSLPPPLLKFTLSGRQWERLAYFVNVLHQDYKARRQMLLKRLEVTVNSFLWSDRTKKLEKQIMDIYNDRIRHLSEEPIVELSHLLASREGLCTEEKTCRTSIQSTLQKLTIGAVPFRGGRVQDYKPLETETFEQQQRAKQQDRGRGHHRGGRGDFGGGRNSYFDSSHRGRREERGGFNQTRRVDHQAPIFDDRYSHFGGGRHDDNRYSYTRQGDFYDTGRNYGYDDNRGDYGDQDLEFHRGGGRRRRGRRGGNYGRRY
ncbi:hypothetical protein ACOME3_003451 [Neoechinorhynchus agilis]